MTDQTADPDDDVEGHSPHVHLTDIEPPPSKKHSDDTERDDTEGHVGGTPIDQQPLESCKGAGAIRDDKLEEPPDRSILRRPPTVR